MVRCGGGLSVLGRGLRVGGLEEACVAICCEGDESRLLSPPGANSGHARHLRLSGVCASFTRDGGDLSARPRG